MGLLLVAVIVLVAWRKRIWLAVVVYVAFVVMVSFLGSACRRVASVNYVLRVSIVCCGCRPFSFA